MWQSVMGLIGFVLIAWLISEDRKQVPLKTIVMGIGLQLAVAIILLKLPFFQDLILSLNRIVMALEESTQAGTAMVFGFLGGGTLPYEEKISGASFTLAFQALPLILVFSALSALLFYWRILPLTVNFFAWGLQKTLGLGGTEGLGVSANIFVGMVESPLFIRPYLKMMTRSEIFTIMTCGMATIAGTVMVLYASILRDVIPGIMGHLLTASIISAPAAITVSKVMIPETGQLTCGDLEVPDKAHSAMDAITRGTMQGVQLLINIISMLVVLVALVHLANLIIGILPQVDGAPLSLQRIMGWLMAPIVWLMGIPWQEAPIAGSIMGTKTILNEFLAYLDLGRLGDGSLSPRSLLILSYALCGFANPGSLGIMIGGMGTMAPERRDEIVSLGLKSLVAGTLATCMTGAVIGILL
jgi:CNT family concentrative nucleoside transporter